MSPISHTDFLTTVRERQAVKHFDPQHNLSYEEIKELLEIASTAPSAWNLQHWTYLAITDKAAKEKLLPIAYGQRQIVEASAVIAVMGNLQAHHHAEAIYDQAVQAGFMPEEVKTNLVRQIMNSYTDAPELAQEEAIRSASMAAMQLMLAAKARGLDSCPMGGYNASLFMEAFGVPRHLVPVMLVAIGRKSVPAHPSTRLPVEETVFWNHF